MPYDSGKPQDTLIPQPGQSDFYTRQFHPLPGPWAQDQMNSNSYEKTSSSGVLSSMTGSSMKGPTGELKKALQAENAQHKYWEEMQGVWPGEPSYENPRELQNTLLPSAKYGTDGQGYGS